MAQNEWPKLGRPEIDELSARRAEILAFSALQPDLLLMLGRRKFGHSLIWGHVWNIMVQARLNFGNKNAGAALSLDVGGALGSRPSPPRSLLMHKAGP